MVISDILEARLKFYKALEQFTRVEELQKAFESLLMYGRCGFINKPDDKVPALVEALEQMGLKVYTRKLGGIMEGHSDIGVEYVSRVERILYGQK